MLKLTNTPQTKSSKSGAEIKSPLKTITKGVFIMKYVYPSIFKLLDNGEYFIKVPDLPGCITEGKNLPDALDMAQDTISMWLCDAEDNNEPTSGIRCI